MESIGAAGSDGSGLFKSEIKCRKAVAGTAGMLYNKGVTVLKYADCGEGLPKGTAPSAKR